MEPQIRFDEDGLVPCVMQDARTGEVLTLAYMNEEALARTRETGEMHFWSRSRGELWRKGETSGNVMRLRALRYDCDEDALVALVDPAAVPPATPASAPASIAETWSPSPARRCRRSSGRSASAAEPTRRELHGRLLADPANARRRRCARRPTRSARAAAEESDERLAEEAADVLYHLTVLLASRGMSLEPPRSRS